MERSRQIFISYAREDRRAALEIFELLRANGFQTWIDTANLLPGQEWAREIDRAIRDSRLFLACLSSTSVTKYGFVQSELKRALKVVDNLPSREVFIIPIRLDDCDLPSELEQYHWLDYFEHNRKDRLLRAISAYVGTAGNTSQNPSDKVELAGARWIGGGMRALSNGMAYPLAPIFDPASHPPGQFHGDACAIRFVVAPKAPWVSLDDIYASVSGFQPLPPYEPEFPLPFEDAHVYYVEIDAPGLNAGHVFHARYWSKEGPTELGAVLLAAGKPEVFVLRLNARTPGIYTFSGYAAVSSEHRKDELQIFENQTFRFDTREGIRSASQRSRRWS